MDPLRINNTRYSWNSLSFTYDGIPFGGGVLSLDYSQVRERKTVYGSRKSGKNVGVTSGKYTTSGSMKMLRETGNLFKTYMSTKGLLSIGDADVNLIIQIAEPVIGSIPQTIVLAGVYIKEMKFSTAEGVDELVDEFVFNDGFDVTENGMTLASRIREIG